MHRKALRAALPVSKCPRPALGAEAGAVVEGYLEGGAVFNDIAEGRLRGRVVDAEGVAGAAVYVPAVVGKLGMLW